MEQSIVVSSQLDQLKTQLNYVHRTWSSVDYEGLLQFYVKILPKIMDAERCSIFLVSVGQRKISLKLGTGLKEGQIADPPPDSIVGRVIESGQVIIENHLNERDGFHRKSDAKTGFQTINIVCVPINSLTGSKITGAIQILNKKNGQSFTQEDAENLQEVAEHLSVAIENIIINQEIMAISRGLEHEVSQIQEKELKIVKFIAESPAMRDVLNQLSRIRKTPVNVFLQGESGVGKELIARIIHLQSDRANKPFVAVNCASIPENLMESEFFGFEKGAFTGAILSRKGKFEDAEDGTLFLDEVGDMPLPIQAKFLRAIEERAGYRLGGNRLIPYNFRIISATNKDLLEEIKKQRFREDLLFRLYSIELVLPPLRERKEDVTPIALAFFDEITARFSKNVAGFSQEVLEAFNAYHWPGNVRQLRREIERLVALTPEYHQMSLNDCSKELKQAVGLTPQTAVSEGECSLSINEQVKALEMSLIKKAFQLTKGNKVRASQLLGITRQGLDKKMKRYECDLKAES